MKRLPINFIFLRVFYMIMWFLEALKNFLKIVILKTGELVSFWGVKTQFGKLPMKSCIEKFDYNQYHVVDFDPIKI